MKRIATLCLLAWGLSGAGAALAANAPPAMIVPGQFNVSATGAATYTIPISVPPGSAGMVPALSLDYSSQSGDGIEGIGWTLSGLPSISRCPRTIAQDSGTHGSVNYDTNDRLCMEGQRLIAVSGGTGYGTDGTVYHTEIESFSKVLEHNGINSSSAWFEVWTKAGQHMEFGNTSDSRIMTVGLSTNVARAWAVDKILDTVGNYLTVTYNSNSDRTTYGEAYPEEIDYTGNASASVSPYNSVKFSYSGRSDSAPMYQAGALTQTTVVLTDIKSYQGANLVYDYRLAYRAGTTVTHSRLTSVTLCDAVGACLVPTTFGWQGGAGQLTINSTGSFGQQAGQSATPSDWDGDGITDELVFSTGACPPYNVWLGPGMTSSGGTLTNGAAGSSACILYPGATIAAPNGTSYFAGAIIAVDVNPHPPPFYFTNNYMFLLSTAGNYNVTQYTAGNNIFLPVTGDFNGDGINDFFAQGYPNPTSYVVYGDSSGGFTPDGGHTGYNGGILAADFDGDGCTDLYNNAGGSSFINFFCNPAVSSISPPSTSGYNITFGDFNGDGKTDILLTSPTAAGILYLSTGTGFASGIAVPSGWGNYEVTVGDWNGDGKADILLVSQVSGTDSEVWLSTGSGFTPALDSSNNPITIANSTGPLGAIIGDWNNDGATDFIMQDGGDTLWYFSYAPELMTSVSNGISSTTNVSYDRLNQNGSFYQKCPTGNPPYTCDSYPTRYLDGPIYVVSRVDASNGLGTCTPPTMTYCYSSTYAYAEAQSDLQGRGFLGFASVAITDPQTSIVQTTSYCTLFPLTGLVSSQVKKHSTTTLNSVSNSYNGVSGCGATGTGGSVNVVNLSESVVASNDLNGASFPTTTTDYTYDSYGNALMVNVSVTGGSSKSTTNTYSNDTTNWFLGRLLTTSVTSVVGASTLTRQSSFTYDAGTGLLTEEDIEPGVSTCNGGSSSCELTTSYTYDAFGHRITTTVFGSGITTRTSYAFYDANGEFQTSAANALGQYEFWNYDARFGTPATHTGPNFLTTNWSYDTFGRMTLETRPDGTKTTQSYGYCGGSCLTYGQFFSQSQILGSNGVQAGPSSTAYFDMLSRGLANDTQGFDGSNIRVATVYDGNGRVQETSRPYFTSGGTAKYTSFAYDDLGRVTQATFPDSSITTYGFNGLVTTVTNNLSQTTTTTKNAQGLNASVEDAASHTTSYVYDAFGNLLTVTDPASNVVANSYDIRGNKVASNDPDMGVWHYAYDVLGELTSQADAGGHTSSLSYDVLGRPLSRTENGLYSAWTYGVSAAAHNIGKLSEAKACTASGCSSVVTDKLFRYDSLTRPSQMVLNTGGKSFAYTDSYNAVNGQLALTGYPSGFFLNHLYNQYGYICRLTDYDHNNPTCSATGGAQVFATVNSRDAELHLTQFTAGNGVVTTQTFDPNTGLIEQQRAGSGGAVASFDYAFDTIGNLTSRADNDESFTEKFCYDSLNRLTNSNMGSACTSGKTVSYDSIGNITAKSDTGTYSYPSSGSARPHAVSSISGVVDGLTNPHYEYDDNGSLTCVSTGSACSGTVGRQVTMTSFNMAAGVIQGNTALSLVYDDQHQRVTQISTDTGANTSTETTYINDAGSGAMSIQTVTGTVVPTKWDFFHWDADPWGGTLPTGTPIFTDYITLDGQIMAQRVSANPQAAAWDLGKWDTTLHWDGIITATKWDFFNWSSSPPAAGTPWTGTTSAGVWDSFTWDAAPWGGPATISYFVLDHLGSVAVVTNESGEVIQRLSYDPWGKQRNPNGSDVACGTITSPTTRGFTNQEELPAQCLVNLNARLYDPSIGRFLAADPVVGDPMMPNAFNRYAYVLNNPLSMIDPTGYDPATETVIVTATAINPVVGAILTVVDVIADIFGFGGLFGGGHPAVVPHAPQAPPPAEQAPAPQIPNASVSQVPAQVSGTPSGVAPETNTLLSGQKIETVIVTGQAPVNSTAAATQAGAFAGVDATSVEQIIVTATKPPPPLITGWIPNLLSPFVSPVVQLIANSPSSANGGNGNHPQYDGLCRMADGSLHPYTDAGGGYVNVYNGGNANASGAGIGEAANSTAMPTLAKPGGISGGGASGPVTSPASSAARDLTGNARLGALRPFTGTGSIGGSIGRAIPVLGTGLMLFDFMQLSTAPVCTPVSNPGTVY